MNMYRNRLWRAETILPADLVQVAFDLFEPLAEAMTSEEIEDGTRVRVILYIRGHIDRTDLHKRLALITESAGIELPELVVEPVPEIDWLAAAFASFKPIDVAGFHIRGSHETAPPPTGAIVITLDASTAFGSGEHATTRGCLKALARLADRHMRAKILDMGTGSAILAIAAAKALSAEIVATDVDPEAIRVARANIRANGVATHIAAVTGDGFSAPGVDVHAPYDLIFANILSGPLIDMAKDIARRLAPGGHVVLAGLLDEQVAAVLTAYTDVGLTLIDSVQIDNWPTLIMERMK